MTNQIQIRKKINHDNMWMKFIVENAGEVRVSITRCGMKATSKCFPSQKAAINKLAKFAFDFIQDEKNGDSYGKIFENLETAMKTYEF